MRNYPLVKNHLIHSPSSRPRRFRSAFRGTGIVGVGFYPGKSDLPAAHFENWSRPRPHRLLKRIDRKVLCTSVPSR